jgi:hypothetical protein
MADLKKGSTGAAVKGIQLRLNTRLKPSPKLNVDGVFGSKTLDAVVRFQRQHSLAADGIVGGKTLAALAAAPKDVTPPNLSKFVAELGTIDDVVRQVTLLEATRKSPQDVMSGLNNFFKTVNGKRYVLVGGDKVGIIDFRHFFAAATESYNSAQSSWKFGVNLGGSPGQAVLLGVCNEIGQCLTESSAAKVKSCFAAEDLGSNRLGAGFGELLKVREAEARAPRVSQLLREYIAKYRPLSPDKTSAIRTADRWDVAMEALAAVVAGLGDILVPRAY